LKQSEFGRQLSGQTAVRRYGEMAEWLKAPVC
jgi:hypothetical protein